MIFLKSINSVIFALYFSQLNTAFGGYNDVDLPESHLPYYFNNNPEAIWNCWGDVRCKHRPWLEHAKYNKYKCWGYERDCTLENSFSIPQCSDQLPSRMKSKEHFVNTFYEQADFGKYLGFSVRDF